MAHSQADRCELKGDVATEMSRDLLAFASELLSFAEREHGRLPHRRTFALPGVSLDIGYSAPQFAELCDRAYLSASAPEDVQSVRLAVLDGEALPHMPRWLGPAPGFHDLTSGLAAHGLRAAYDAGFATWDIYDPARSLGVRAMQATTLRPPWEPSFPLRLLLHWAARDPRRGMIHAGTLGHRGYGVFLVGAGGSGKSGTTLSGILHGLTSVGDDYVAVNSPGTIVEALPVLRRMKQDVAGLRRLGLAAGKGPLDGPPNWQGKIEFDFEALAAGARAERLTMTAILMPHIARAPSSSFRAATAKEAMIAMAPSSLFQLHGSWREDFGLIASVARTLRAFHLDLGEDPKEIAAAIRSFLESKSAR